jgi:hypothetical protein
MSVEESSLGMTEVRNRIGTFEDLLRIAVEKAGLGRDGKQHEHRAFVFLNDSRIHYRSGNLEAANDLVNRGEALVHDYLHGHGPVWRLVNVHQFHLYLFYVAMLVLTVGLGLNDVPGGRVWIVPFAAFGFGALGAILRGLYHMHRQVSRGVYREQFLLAHLCAPLVGALFGAFTYLLLAAGVLTFEGGREVDVSGSASPYALIFLAGFSWEWFSRWLEQRFGTGRKAQGAPPPAPAEARPQETAPAPAAPPTGPEGAETNEETPASEAGSAAGSQDRPDERTPE